MKNIEVRYTLQIVVSTMMQKRLYITDRTFLSEFSEESDQWNARHVTLIGFDNVHYISSHFSAFVVFKVYTYRPCVLGTHPLSLK